MIETKVIERNEDDSDFTYDNDMEEGYKPFEYVLSFKPSIRQIYIFIFRVPRDSKHIKIGLTLRAKETASLFISYEQLVTRRLGIYELVLNLHPGQVEINKAEEYITREHEHFIINKDRIRFADDGWLCITRDVDVAHVA